MRNSYLYLNYILILIVLRLTHIWITTSVKPKLNCFLQTGNLTIVLIKKDIVIDNRENKLIYNIYNKVIYIYIYIYI